MCLREKTQDAQNFELLFGQQLSVLSSTELAGNVKIGSQIVKTDKFQTNITVLNNLLPNTDKTWATVFVNVVIYPVSCSKKQV